MPIDKGTGEKAKVAKAAGVVGSATMLSRIFGFIRDMVVAALFGAGLATDAFFVAFRIPNLLRRLLAEGSLTVSFVPVFTEYLTQKSREEANELACVTFTALFCVLIVVTLLGILFAPSIVTITAPGFVTSPLQFKLAVSFTRLMFPYIFFISLVALCMGILNSFRHFAAPALAPVVLNISMITTSLALYHYFSEPLYALAWGVIAGGILQLALQVPFLLKYGIHLKFNFSFRHPGLKKIATLITPTLLGSAVYQLNVFIGTILASLLPKGSVSYLYYADRIVELPLGVFAIAVGTASLPSFSTHVAEGDWENLKKTINFSLRLLLFVTIPAMVALLILAEPIISVLFKRGAFNEEAVLRTSQALFYYSLGLWAFSVVRVIDSVFFSLQDRRSPLIAAFLSFLTNVGMSLLLMGPLKHGGLALATSIASALNVLILHMILRKKLGSYLDKSFFTSLRKTILASLLMGVTLLFLPFLMPRQSGAPFLQSFSYIVINIGCGLAVFFLSSLFVKHPELMAIVNNIKKLTKPHQNDRAKSPYSGA